MKRKHGIERAPTGELAGEALQSWRRAKFDGCKVGTDRPQGCCRGRILAVDEKTMTATVRILETWPYI